MKRRMASLLAASALFLSLCGCGGGVVDPDRYGSGGEIGASPSTGIDPSSSKTIHQSGSGTGRASGQTGTTTSQTAATRTGTTTRALEVLKYGNHTWEEVPFKKETGWMHLTDILFNLRGSIATTDYVFSGTIISLKEYECFSTDEQGKIWGPATVSVIEAKVDQTYYGQLPIKDGIIKIYYLFSLSRDFENAVVLKEQEDYVFIARSSSIYSDCDPDIAHFTDVCISPAYYFDVFPIENGKVLAYAPYFDWNQDLMKNVKPDIKTDRISSGETGEQYVVMDKKDFEDAFNWLFENLEALPTVKNIFAPDETTSGQTEATTGQTTATETHPATGQAAAATGAGTTTRAPEPPTQGSGT